MSPVVKVQTVDGKRLAKDKSLRHHQQNFVYILGPVVIGRYVAKI
jgi:hypothetical protein